MKKRMSICFFLFIVCLFHLSIPDTVFSQEEVTNDVFERYQETFRYPDVHAFFPDILRAFKDPEIQAVLHPIIINDFAIDPRSIGNFLKDVDNFKGVDDSIVVLLTINEEFQALFEDNQFHTVLQNPTEIDRLVELIEGTTPRARENDCEIPPPEATTLTIFSGYGQKGQPGTRLPDPFVVIVRDQYGDPFSQSPVTFKVIKGESSLSRTRVTPNSAGRASTYLTLGSDAGAIWVEASVAGIPLPQVFTATASVELPSPDPPEATTLTIFSGYGQKGQPGTRLLFPFVVIVRDQYGDPFSQSPVTFKVTKGEGKLSRTIQGGGSLLPITVTPDPTTGQASTYLTLGSDTGAIWVEASVAGIPLPQVFTATATLETPIPPRSDPPEATTLTIFSGYGQEDQLGSRLPDPFVVIVRDQYGDPFSQSPVTFKVIEGEGSLSRTRVTPNSAGRASTYLTLGSDAGAIWVEASVAGIPLSQVFTATATLETLDSDVNGDGIVSPIDLSIVFSLITKPNSDIADVDADINKDGIIDHEDLVLVASALESIAAAPSIHVLRQEGISARDVQEMLTQAKALSEATQADPVYQRGIVALERLLAVLTKVPVIPKQTALLPNYPNPFNPETWIPYELSEATDVEVSIYAVDGRLVRTLTLGHQSAGLYQRKSRAAYWDGRNDFGERIASGLYFYTLTAGNFTATRKMLIRK